MVYNRILSKILDKLYIGVCGRVYSGIYIGVHNKIHGGILVRNTMKYTIEYMIKW